MIKFKYITTLFLSFVVIFTAVGCSYKEDNRKPLESPKEGLTQTQLYNYFITSFFNRNIYDSTFTQEFSVNNSYSDPCINNFGTKAEKEQIYYYVYSTWDNNIWYLYLDKDPVLK